MQEIEQIDDTLSTTFCAKAQLDARYRWHLIEILIALLVVHMFYTLTTTSTYKIFHSLQKDFNPVLCVMESAINDKLGKMY